MKPLSVAMNADSGEKTWLTPPRVVEALGPFDLDPCCPPKMRGEPPSRWCAAPTTDSPWTGRASAYGATRHTDAKPCRSSARWRNTRGGGIALIFARTDTSAWQDLVFPVAHGVLFLRGRLRFHRADGTQGETATAPSALVAYSAKDFARLRKSGLAGALVTLEGGMAK